MYRQGVLLQWILEQAPLVEFSWELEGEFDGLERFATVIKAETCCSARHLRPEHRPH